MTADEPVTPEPGPTRETSGAAAAPPMDVDRPWQALVELARQTEPEELAAYVDGLGAGESARALGHLSADEHCEVLLALGAENAADLLEQLPRVQAADIVEHLPTAYAADILQELPGETEADILRDLGPDEAEAVLAQLPAQNAAQARALQRYADDTAGGLMTPRFLSVRLDSTVEEVVEHMREHALTHRDVEVQYVYVLDDDGGLRGVLRLRDLLLARPHEATANLMIGDPVHVDAAAPLAALAELFAQSSFLGIPVVDEGRLVGVLRRGAVLEELGEDAHRDHLKAAGIVGGEELRAMELLPRARRRLSWLSVNIGLNVIAASVIAAYEHTLSSVIALAVFLPIISDMSGCSGNQAVAVSMRELSLGLVRPRDLFYVWGKEISVGLINGVVLGLLLGVVAFLWKGNPWLGLVAGAALAINTLIAVSIGGTVPLILKHFGVDPAVASGPVLTTITDLCGFLLVLGMATALLHRLT